MMKKWMRGAVAGMLLLSMMTTAGCSSERAESDMNIAVICKSKDEYWNSVWKACDDAEEEMGITTMRLAPDSETIDDQISMINQAVSAHVDAIVLAAVDMDAENEALRNATTAGIPVLTIDSDVSYEGRASYIGTQNRSAAAIVARHTKELLNNDGKVGIIYHGAVSTADLRKSGFLDEIAPPEDAQGAMPAGAGSKHNNSQSDEDSNTDEQSSEPETASTESNIKIVEPCDGEGDMEISKDMAKKLIKEEHVNLIYTTNQPGTRGACEAISELIDDGTIQPDEVQLVGFDYFDGAYNYITSGILDAVIVQNPYNMGYLGIRYARNLIKDEEVASLVDTGAILVTTDNIDDDDIQFLINPSEN